MHKLHLSCVEEYGLIMDFILLGPYQCKLCIMVKLTAICGLIFKASECFRRNPE